MSGQVRMLIVDDNQTRALEVCEAINEIEGDAKDVTIANSPLAAMGMLSKNPYHFVFCASRMAVVTGLEFARHVGLAGIETNLILLKVTDHNIPPERAREFGVAMVLDISDLANGGLKTATQSVEENRAAAAAPAAPLLEAFAA